MSVQQDNIAATQSLFAAFGAADIPGILALCNDDIVIDFYGPSIIPYAGHYEGLEAARRFFGTVLGAVDINQFDAEEFLADADKVVVTGHLNLTSKRTGGVIDSDFVHVITLRDARWSHFRDFMDTAVAVAAYSLPARG